MLSVLTLHLQFLKKLEHFKQLSSKNIPFYFLIFEEIFTEDNEYKNLIDILEKHNLHSVKVSMTTNNKIKIFNTSTNEYKLCGQE